MSKLTDSIEGYAGMTAEEKLAHLEAFEVPDYSKEIDALKSTRDKLSKENAEYKRQMREKMSTEEQEKLDRDNEIAERDQLIQTLRDENDGYRKASQKATAKASYIALGYDESLAQKAADAEVDGKFAELHDCMKTHLENVSKKAKETVTRGTPSPKSGSESKTTKEEFSKMSYRELVKLKTENPELYAELSK